MARTELRQKRQADHACPVCKRPVATVLARHKTLGIFVPHWGPGPCRNPECPDYAAETEGRTENTDRRVTAE
ncbi:hypothetical protein [Streptomyces sp. B1I3]|uniref:hypothetical protein n=1 Tax=Streptomyces sp. B1I3 TaxID=3042264 RepID=UPI0027D8D791|nr:hypothetical protein [Streptomyces sp. B1I3]